MIRPRAGSRNLTYSQVIGLQALGSLDLSA